MQNVDRLFILTGILFILVGMGLGLYMGSHQDYTLHALHAHLNLLGFVLMFLFGLAYHVWPAMKQSVMSIIHYALHTVGTVVSMIALYFLLSDPSTGPTLGPVADIFSGLTGVGVLIFAYLFWTKAKS